MSHAEKLYTLGETMASNLNTMGVSSADASDGLTTLANKILDVQSGVVIDTSVSIIPTVYSVLPGESVTVNGVLSALYDGTVDLVGQLGGGTIKIYDGNTLVDTVTTDSNGAFTSTFTLTGFGEHSLKAVFDGVANVFDDCESSAVVVYCTNTVITLNVPMSLIYSDAFSITGVLKDTSNNVLANKTVSLLVGGTCVDTDTTDNNGEFSFTQTPVRMGTHSFQITFEGDITYYPTASSVVTREIGKETSVLNVSSPTMNTNVYSDGSLTVSGTLQSNDAEAIAGASVLVKQDGTTLTTLTTDSNGAFTGSVNASNLDTGNLDIIFESNSTHTASSASISIVVNDPTLTLVSDKSILSYVDHDVATLTATYTGANPSGKVVSFDIVDENGDVIENIDSATTDSNGVCSVYYSSNGAGVIYIRANQGIFLSETYGITDAKYYDASSSSNLSKYSTNASMTYDSTEQAYLLTTGTSQDWQWKKTTLNNVVFPYDCTVRAKIKLTDNNSNNQFVIGLENTRVVVGFTTIAGTNYWILLSELDNSISTNYQEDRAYLNSSTLQLNTWYTVELIYTSTTATFKIYNGSTLLATTSFTTSALDSTSNSLILFTGMRPSVKQYVKDIIVL